MAYTLTGVRGNDDDDLINLTNHCTDLHLIPEGISQSA